MLYCICQQKNYKYIKRQFQEQISQINLLFPKNNGKYQKRNERRKDGMKEGREEMSDDLGYFLIFH